MDEWLSALGSYTASVMDTGECPLLVRASAEADSQHAEDRGYLVFTTGLKRISTDSSRTGSSRTGADGSADRRLTPPQGLVRRGSDALGHGFGDLVVDREDSGVQFGYVYAQVAGHRRAEDQVALVRRHHERVQCHRVRVWR